MSKGKGYINAIVMCKSNLILDNGEVAFNSGKFYDSTIDIKKHHYNIYSTYTYRCFTKIDFEKYFKIIKLNKKLGDSVYAK